MLVGLGQVSFVYLVTLYTSYYFIILLKSPGSKECPKQTRLYANVAIFSLPNGIKDVLFHKEGPLSRFQNKGPCLLSINMFLLLQTADTYSLVILG